MIKEKKYVVLVDFFLCSYGGFTEWILFAVAEVYMTHCLRSVATGLSIKYPSKEIPNVVAVVCMTVPCMIAVAVELPTKVVVVLFGIVHLRSVVVGKLLE